MASVKFKNITKIYEGNVKAVDNFTLDVPDKQFCVFVGPSGCGKSTTLRMVAGLEKISGGELYIGDTLVNYVSPENRDIAMVFQNYALYPHMTVYGNMSFGLKIKKFPQSEIDKRVRKYSKILQIDDLLQRKPKELSGGQKQRVAMGRAIVRQPKVFLFDEPLSNLDAKLRVEMRKEIAKLHTQLETTVIYVTHDQVEAMTMGDIIVVMKDGIIHQVDGPARLYNHPKNKFVAGFIGTPPMNFIDASLKIDGNNYTLITQDNQISLSTKLIGKLKEKAYTKEKITLGVRPEDVIDSAIMDNPYKNNELKGSVILFEMLGSHTNILIKESGHSHIFKLSKNIPVPDRGSVFKLLLNMDRVKLFDFDSGETVADIEY